MALQSSDLKPPFYSNKNWAVENDDGYGVVKRVDAVILFMLLQGPTMCINNILCFFIFREDGLKGIIHRGGWRVVF